MMVMLLLGPRTVGDMTDEEPDDSDGDRLAWRIGGELICICLRSDGRALPPAPDGEVEWLLLAEAAATAAAATIEKRLSATV